MRLYVVKSMLLVLWMCTLYSPSAPENTLPTTAQSTTPSTFSLLYHPTEYVGLLLRNCLAAYCLCIIEIILRLLGRRYRSIMGAKIEIASSQLRRHKGRCHQIKGGGEGGEAQFLRKLNYGPFSVLRH